MDVNEVTILILIDGFLQSGKNSSQIKTIYSHNPYFNRWFSAIDNFRVIFNTHYSHNPYFNRWFSAIKELDLLGEAYQSHNPYFNRWFSAIS